MRRQEELRKIALCYAHDELKDSQSPIEDVVAAAFIDGVNYADAHPWISVEDELPPKDKAYLAYWQHLGVTKYRYVKAGAKVSRTFSEHITHWMPLPPTEEIRGNQGKTSPNQEGGEE